MRSFKGFSGFGPVASFGVSALCLGTLFGTLSAIGGTARGVPTINPRQMEFGSRLHF